MSAIDHEDEWDTEEFQTALKIVLKYEIQSLLERLAFHGEETVLLTANREDNCVGHLASSNAQKFVDTKDVGDLKTKFLTFLIGPSKQMRQFSGVPQSSRANTTAAGNQQMRGQYVSQSGHQQTATRFRGTDHDTDTLSDPELTPRKLDTAQSVTSQVVKQGAKRPLEDISMSKDKLVNLQPDTKRRKGETSKTNQPQVPGPRPASLTENKTTNILPRVSQSHQKPEKLHTTKVVSKSGFVEERLSQAEFQKIIQKYKHASESEGIDEEDFEEEDYDEDDEEYSELLEEGEIRFPYMGAAQQPTTQQQQSFQQKQLGQKHPPSVNISNSGSMTVNMNKGTTPKATGKPGEVVKKLSDTSGGIVKLNSAGPMPFNKTTSVSGIKSSSEGKATEITNTRDVKESDGDTKKGADQSQVKTNKTKPELKAKEDSVHERDKTGTTQSKDAEQTIPGSNQQKKRFSDNVDEMDTESLIKMVKERHAQSQSDADKQIQAKLGQLSSKLSWVVEYPKDQQSGETQQKMHMVRPEFPLGMEEEYMEDEEDEEDYDEDYDEDELDEQELAALAYMRKMTENQMGVQRMGHFEGAIEEGTYEEDYDEEMEGFDAQHRVFNPADQMRMLEYGEGEEEQGQGEFAAFQRTASPSLDNFLFIGSSMAKCLVCNKIVRKAELKQHNEIHLQEGAEEGEEGEEEEEELEEEDGGEEDFHGQEGEGNPDIGEYREMVNEDYHEQGDLGEEEGERELDMAEFTAEPLVAEKIVEEKITTDLKSSKPSEKSTRCDICDKNYKSYGNMIRHRKIHTESREVQCPVCDKSFKLQPYLLKHLKNLHPDYKHEPQGGAPADGDGGAQDGGADEGTGEEKSQPSN